ncbi:hypothetical protein ACGF1Z_35125 [Streptomyces sp. NPDC048018]|uniref:hypothetical protein n=1 Tax=Streptomyces sp. NPDC048018 TaxID=3365499 RepID=UPI0037157366
MGVFLVSGIEGFMLLAVSPRFDGVLGGVFDGFRAGLFDGWLSLPVVAGFVSVLGITGAIVVASTELGPTAAAAAGAVAGARELDNVPVRPRRPRTRAACSGEADRP